MDANNRDATEQVGAIPAAEIALRAYLLWQDRGSPLGSPEEDWLRAEQEIRGRIEQEAPHSAVGPRA